MLLIFGNLRVGGGRRQPASCVSTCEKEMHLYFSTTMSDPIHFIASVFRINELVSSLQLTLRI